VIPLHALDQHLHNAITWVRNVGERAVLCCINGRIDELNLNLKMDILQCERISLDILGDHWTIPLEH
jgi:hypothetical protein